MLNPSTGEQIAEAPVCTKEEVEEGVASCWRAFPGWSSKPVAVRTQVIFKFRELVNAHFEELSVLLATEMGKNLDESRGDVFKVIEACELSVGAPLELQGYSLMEAARSHISPAITERKPEIKKGGAHRRFLPSGLPPGDFRPHFFCGTVSQVKID